MVTVEQGGDQFQNTTNTTQTGVPQQAPANLQPNGSAQTDIQNAVSTTDLFGNPQENAIITISGTGNQTAESLVAANADISIAKASNQTTILVAGALLVIMIGSFLIVRKIAKY